MWGKKIANELSIKIFLHPRRSMLMTASDLSAITKPWPEQKRVGLIKKIHFTSHVWVHHNLNLSLSLRQIARLVAMEFFAQGDKEKKEFKIKPIVSLDRKNAINTYLS